MNDDIMKKEGRDEVKLNCFLSFSIDTVFSKKS